MRIPTLFLAAVMLLLMSSIGFSDMTCSCGTVVHTNNPTTCPVCSSQLPIFTPGPRPGPPNPGPYPNPGLYPTDPHGVNDSSGLKLGVVIVNAAGRVLVQRVIPQTPAEGHFFPNDQIVKGAFRDAASGQVYSVPIYSPNDLTRLKTLAGPGNRVAMRVSRPTTGARSFFVTFAAQGGGVARAYSTTAGVGAAAPAAAPAVSASVTDDVNGEAAGWLDNSAPQRGNQGVPAPAGVPTPAGPTPGVIIDAANPPVIGGGDTAESLLGQ